MDFRYELVELVRRARGEGSPWEDLSMVLSDVAEGNDPGTDDEVAAEAATEAAAEPASKGAAEESSSG